MLTVEAEIRSKYNNVGGVNLSQQILVILFEILFICFVFIHTFDSILFCMCLFFYFLCMFECLKFFIFNPQILGFNYLFHNLYSTC